MREGLTTIAVLLLSTFSPCVFFVEGCIRLFMGFLFTGSMQLLQSDYVRAVFLSFYKCENSKVLIRA